MNLSLVPSAFGILHFHNILVELQLKTVRNIYRSVKLRNHQTHPKHCRIQSTKKKNASQDLDFNFCNILCILPEKKRKQQEDRDLQQSFNLQTSKTWFPKNTISYRVMIVQKEFELR